MAYYNMSLDLMRAFLLLSLCCSGVAYGNGVTQDNAEVPKDGAAYSSVSLCVRVEGNEGAEENQYVVNLFSNKLESETRREIPRDQPSGCTPSSGDRNLREAFSRLISNVNTQHATNPQNVQTVYEAVTDIQNSVASGYSPARFVVFSPDGAYAVLSPLYGPHLLLVEVSTLETTILAKAYPENPPVAWSPDSRFIAFAPRESDTLQIFSVAKLAVVSTFSDTGPWVVALSWSPDSQLIAAFELRHRRMSIGPFALISAISGHPEFRNDGVLGLYKPVSSQHSSLLLMHGINEMHLLNATIQWK